MNLRMDLVLFSLFTCGSVRCLAGGRESGWLLVKEEDEDDPRLSYLLSVNVPSVVENSEIRESPHAIYLTSFFFSFVYSLIK